MRINEYIPINGKYFNRQIKVEHWYPLVTRRPRLTLKHLSKLRKQREMRRIEKRKHDKNIPEIYKIPDKDPKSRRE
jgi:hypothetical protein